MFDQLVVSSVKKRRKTWLRYFSVTAAVWIAVLALVVVGGVWSYDARLSDMARFIPLATPELPVSRGTPRPLPKRDPNQQASRPPSELVAQVKPPERVNDTPQTAVPPIVGFVTDPGVDKPGGPGIGGPGGNEHGVVGGLEIPDRGKHIEPPEPEKKDPPPQTQTPAIQVVRSGGVIQGTAVRRANPVYPPLARAARVSGAVIVEVVVDQAGNVTSARVLSGHALLREAAAAAARQWKWNPTYLTGVPVQVVGTITFNFTL